MNYKKPRFRRPPANTIPLRPDFSGPVTFENATGPACGGCRACCTTLIIAELDKPMHTPCPHECAAGCAIYAARPPSCKEFFCLYRAGGMSIEGSMEDLRPDNLGVMFWARTPDKDDFPFECFLQANETRPGALQTPFAQSVIRQLAKHYLVWMLPIERTQTPGETTLNMAGTPEMLARLQAALVRYYPDRRPVISGRSL